MDSIIYFVYITTKDIDEAEKIGKFITEERLAGCVNIFPRMKSFFWWKGNLENSEEAVVIAKTIPSKFDLLKAKVKEIHSYTCPCILAFPIVDGNQEYIDWLKAEMEC